MHSIGIWSFRIIVLDLSIGAFAFTLTYLHALFSMENH